MHAHLDFWMAIWIIECTRGYPYNHMMIGRQSCLGQDVVNVLEVFHFKGNQILTFAF